MSLLKSMNPFYRQKEKRHRLPISSVCGLNELGKYLCETAQTVDHIARAAGS